LRLPGCGEALRPAENFSFKVVDACHRSLTRQRRVSIGTQRCWVASTQASNIELPVSAVRHPVEIPASTPTNKLLQLGGRLVSGGGKTRLPRCGLAFLLRRNASQRRAITFGICESGGGSGPG
jgi:hypothetical protein